jgi:hypothetical protein
VERLLVQQEYGAQGKAARGLVRRYIEKMTGLSRANWTSEPTCDLWEFACLILRIPDNPPLFVQEVWISV